MAFSHSRCTQAAADQRRTGLEGGAALSTFAAGGAGVAFVTDRHVGELPAMLLLLPLSILPLMSTLDMGCPIGSADDPRAIPAFATEKEARDYREQKIAYERICIGVSLASSGAMLLGARSGSGRAVIGAFTAVPLIAIVAGLVTGSFSPDRPLSIAF
jgi:hypothetical protein